jgi:hypothetical protein
MSTTKKCDFHTLLQHICMHLILILISIRDSNVMKLNIWTRFSLNQETETKSDEINSDDSESIYVSQFKFYI